MFLVWILHELQSSSKLLIINNRAITSELVIAYNFMHSLLNYNISNITFDLQITFILWDKRVSVKIQWISFYLLQEDTALLNICCA